MNDTFDDLTFANLTSNIEKSTIAPLIENKSNIHPHQLEGKKKYLKKVLTNKNDISFDDSLFLNSQEFSVLNSKELEKSTNSNLTDDIFDYSFTESFQEKKLGKSIEGFITLPSLEGNEEQAPQREFEDVSSPLKPESEKSYLSTDSDQIEKIRSTINSSNSLNKKTQENEIERFENFESFFSPLEVENNSENKLLHEQKADLFNKSQQSALKSSNSTTLEKNQEKIDSDEPIKFKTPAKPPTTQALQLSSWGLPPAILEKYSTRNVITMFPWQAECLNNPKILKKYANLVYSAPTSAGKTLVAEILAIKTVLERKKKSIFILPFVSVVREKMFYFQDILSTSGVRVEGFMGSYNPPGGFKSVQFAICTIEKANSLINNCLQDGSLGEIGAVIIDEMHLLGEPNRGYLLELLLTKLRYITLKEENIKIQIIGMSATLPNLELLARWLDAELYVTNFRPIPLFEQALIGGAIYDTQCNLIRKLEPLPDLGTDTDNILQLCLETITENCSVLIFCPTKNWCENLAQQISTAFYKLGSSQGSLSLELRKQLRSDLIVELLEQLKFCPVGLDGVLYKTVSFGVAFHHAGLTLDERDIIEAGFRNGVIRVLVATSTLSSGVNLPAKRVIIRTPLFHGRALDSLTYRQMIGRAGRMGRDTSGESILVCQKTDEKIAKKLMTEALQPIESCLEGAGRLKRAILEIVASGVASTPDDVQLFTKCTLLALRDEFDNPIDEALEFLVSNEFLRLNDQKYVATSLGRACLSSSIPPEDGLALFTELEKARQCFVLESELHLIYLVTPYSACNQWGNIDWMFYLNLWEKLPSSMKRVGELVGVKESYLVSATRGKLQTNTSKLYHKLLVHKRFFVALALQDLVNEKPLGEVCQKFSCNRGMLQTLQLTASTFAGMVTSFSKHLGWSSVEILISQFQDRLHFGVSRDLLDLMKLPILNGKSARALFNSGLETLAQIANSDLDTIEEVFHKAMPFESGKLREGESEFGLKERNKLRNIWISGKEGLTEREAAELLLRSAREYLRIELGLKEAKWDTNKTAILDSSDSATSQKSQNISDCSLFETSITENTPSRFSSRNLSLNSSGDFITTSQDELSFSLKDITRSSRKRPKRGKENQVFLQYQSPLKKTKTIDDHESCQLTDIELVDVCQNHQLFSAFTNEIKRETTFSLAVGCSLVEEKKRMIGLTPESQTEVSFVHKNCKVEGFAFFWGGQTVYYLDVNKMPTSVDLIRSLLDNEQLVVMMFDSKEHIKVMKNCCGIDFRAKIEDSKVCDWILDPEGREKNFQAMVQVYCPNFAKIAHTCGISKQIGSPSLDIYSSIEPKYRSSIESYLSWHLTKFAKNALFKQNSKLFEVYATELRCLRILAQMELVGVGVNKSTLTHLVSTLNHKQTTLEKQAYTLAGRRFSFLSSKEVSKVLGFAKKVSTKKQVLEKMENPICDLILQWRKINCTVTKMIQPLIRGVENGRIHGCYITHTATGRISMHEPNLQNVAKNFDIDGVKISCRDAFVPQEGYVLVSADYCQLELRLLAHLSKDKVLCKIMKSQGDVFKSVAAKWNGICEEEVTDDLRQKAKQICYGIIYGMGSKTLAEQLSIEEEEASMFMESFRNAYPGIKTYVKEVLEKCQKNGYVETLAGRRRFLPHINHRSSSTRSQAERQAVNTTIQGSAADIVKNTMVVLEEKCATFKDKPKLVLHLHDELLYEVPNCHLRSFVKVLKTTMEDCVKLSIPFPVKVKVGPSWGQLTEYL